MKSLASWLLVMFMGLFWIFRIIIAFQDQYGKDLGGFIAFNSTIEVILIFVVMLCMILVVRRILLGGIIYFLGYGYYFGGYILTTGLSGIMTGGASMGVLQNTFVSLIGLIIAFCVLFDLIIARVRRKDPKDKKTDWFFQNENYDRKYDERADRNEYKL